MFRALATQRSWLLYLAAIVTLVLGVYLFVLPGSKAEEDGAAAAGADEFLGSEAGGAVQDERAEMAVVAGGSAQEAEPTSMVAVCSFAFLSAVFGAGSYCNSKIMSELLGNVAGGRAQPLAMVELGVAVACILLFAYLQIHWMNVALASCNCLTVVPVYYALAIMLQTVTSGVLFNEFASLPAFSLGMLAFGGAVLLYGVYELSTGHVTNTTGEVAELDRAILGDSDHAGPRKATAMWTRARIRMAAASLTHVRHAHVLRKLRAGSAVRPSLAGL